MNLSSKHIILIILAIIILAFIYSYDVYIVEKNQPICKPIYITKKILTPDAEELLLDNGVSNSKENMQMIDNDIIEGFNTIMGATGGNTAENVNLNIPGVSLSSFTVSGVTDKQKIKVMDSVIKVLSNIPTNLDINSIKQMVEYFGMIYQTSSSLANFYQNVSSSTKIKDAPYNSKYSQLILYLIGKFNNDVEDCIERPKGECGLIVHPEKPENKPESKPENKPETKPKTIPEYLQCETCNIKPEVIKKITSEIVNNVTNEITNEIVHDVTNEIAQEIKHMYPKPENRPENRPEYKPEYRPENRPEYRPENRPEYRPEYKPEYRPEQETYPEYMHTEQEHFSNNTKTCPETDSIISNIIDRILPSKQQSSQCNTPTYVTCPSCPTMPIYPIPPYYPGSQEAENRYYPSGPNSYPGSQEAENRNYPTGPNNYPSGPSGYPSGPNRYPGRQESENRNYPNGPGSFPGGSNSFPGSQESEGRYYPGNIPSARPGYPGTLPEQENPFNNYPGNFNPPEQINIQKNKPCYDKCSVQCPVSKPDYLANPEPFGMVQSYDEGTDYYSLLN